MIDNKKEREKILDRELGYCETKEKGNEKDAE